MHVGDAWCCVVALDKSLSALLHYITRNAVAFGPYGTYRRASPPACHMLALLVLFARQGMAHVPKLARMN